MWLQQESAFLRAGTLCLCTTLLAACGGGGGGGNDEPVEHPRVAISATTEPRVTAQALESVLQSQTDSALDALSSGSSTNPLKQVALARQQAAKRAIQAAKSGLQVSASDTLPCTVSGSVTITVNVANLSAPLQSAGDSVGASFNACVEAAGIVIGGSLGISVVSVTATTSVWDVQANNLSITIGNHVWRESGTTRLTTDDSTAGVSKMTTTSARSTHFLSVDGQQRASYSVLNSTLTSEQNDTTGTVSATANFTASGTFNGLGDVSYKVETLAPLQGPVDADHPISGTLKVTGAGNATVTLLLGEASVRVVADYNGDGVADSDTTRTWEDIDAQL